MPEQRVGRGRTDSVGNNKTEIESGVGTSPKIIQTPNMANGFVTVTAEGHTFRDANQLLEADSRAGITSGVFGASFNTAELIRKVKGDLNGS